MIVMDREQARTWRFLMWAAPPLIPIGLLLYAVGVITLLNLILVNVAMAGVFLLARSKLRTVP